MSKLLAVLGLSAAIGCAFYAEQTQKLAQDASTREELGRHEIEQVRAELDRTRSELADTRAKQATLIDPSQLDPPTFLALAERARVDPRQLAAWLRQHATPTPTPPQLVRHSAQAAPTASTETYEAGPERHSPITFSPAPFPTYTAPVPQYDVSEPGSDHDVSGSGPVHVRGYVRKDGTVVQPHFRSAPSR